MKKVFHPGMYVESLRQLRMIGWMAFLIFALESILVPVYRLDNSAANELIRESALEMHPLMTALFLAAAPLMMLYLFSFLNKRSGSDYYHAVPVARTAMFVSMTAAVLTWCLFLIVSGYAMAVLFRLCFGYRFTAYLNLLEVLVYMGGLAVKCVWMIGLAAIAVSVSGTGFTNVLVLLLLLCGPRALIYILTNAVYDILPFLSDTGMTSKTFIARFYEVTTHIGSTVLLGVLYLLAGGVLFYFRKSETAGQSAPNRVVQALFRLVIPTLFSVWATVSSYTYGISAQRPFDWADGLMIYAISVVLYLLYELVTTRKWRNVARALPGLLILAALNFAAVGGVQLACRVSASYRPAAGEIAAVQQVNNGYRSDSYYKNQVAQAKLTDRELCDLIADAISTQSKTWTQSPSLYRSNYQTQPSTSWATFRVYDAHGRSRVRRIYLDYYTSKALNSAYENDGDLQRRLQNFPEASSIAFSSRYLNWSLDDAALSQVYDAFRAEIAGMSYRDIRDALGGQVEMSDERLIVTIKSGTQTYTQIIPIGGYPFYKTAEAFTALTADYNRAQQAEIQKMMEKYEEMSNDMGATVLSFSINTTDSMERSLSAYWTSEEKVAAQASEPLIKMFQTDMASVKFGYPPLYYISLEWLDTSGGDWSRMSRASAAYQLTDEQVKLLEEAIEIAQERTDTMIYDR